MKVGEVWRMKKHVEKKVGDNAFSKTKRKSIIPVKDMVKAMRVLIVELKDDMVIFQHIAPEFGYEGREDAVPRSVFVKSFEPDRD